MEDMIQPTILNIQKPGVSKQSIKVTLSEIIAITEETRVGIKSPMIKTQVTTIIAVNKAPKLLWIIVEFVIVLDIRVSIKKRQGSANYKKNGHVGCQACDGQALPKL
jgi:hypothetical protein